MIRTLTVSLDDIEKSDRISISGTQHANEFNKTIILSIGQTKIALDSESLAQALAAVVDFQAVPKQTLNTFNRPE